MLSREIIPFSRNGSSITGFPTPVFHFHLVTKEAIPV